MVDTPSTATPAPSTTAPSGAATPYPQPTGWVGWSIFGATMMMIAGGLNAFYGMIALVNDEWIVWGNRGDVYLDVTQWGWVHLILGALVFLAGLGVLTGNVVARIVGVALASLSLVANFMFLPVYPLWALTVMTLDVLVIWALTAHGGELRTVHREEQIDIR